MRKREIIISCSLLVLITALAFLPALKNGFTYWDDDKLVTKNRTIQHLSWQTIKHIFTSFYLNTYIPLTVLSFAIEYHFFKLNPLVYHTTNVILHLCNTLIVFWLIYRLSKNSALALVTALLFGVHPLRVESVAWVTERKDVLYALFYLSALIGYIYYQQLTSPRFLYLSLFLFLFSLLSKGVAITLPLALLLCDYYIQRPLNPRIILEKIPFFVLSLVFLIIGLFAQYPPGTTPEEKSYPLWHNIQIASHGILFYLGKTIFPVALSAIYPHPEKIGGMLPWQFRIAPFLLLIVISAIIYFSRYTRIVTFGGLFFFLLILPVSEIIPLVGEAIAADRYTYLPSIGLSYLAGEGFCWLFQRRFKQRPALKYSLLGIMIAIVTLFAVLTHQRCKVWKNHKTLMTDVIFKYPRAPVAYNNRGSGYLYSGEYDKAIADFSRAIQLRQHYADAYNNRGTAYFLRSNYEKALADFTQALKYNPNHKKAYYNLGTLFLNRGEIDKAIEMFNIALQFDPGYGEAYNNRGTAFMRKQETAKAIADYSSAIKLNPNWAEVYYNRGVAFAQQRDYTQALDDFSRALRLNPTDVNLYSKRAVLYYLSGNYAQAWADVHRIQQLGGQIDSAFIADLRRASGREQ